MRFHLHAWVGLVVLASSAADGRAETVKEPGFELALPAGFVASSPSFVATVRSQLAGQAGLIPGASIEIEAAKLWAYERPSGAGLPDRALLIWFPGSGPDPDEPTLRRGLRESFARVKGTTGVEVEEVVARALPGDVSAVEARARYATVGARVRMLIVPRAGFVLMLQLLRFTADADGDEAVWDAVVAGLRTTAAAPSPAPRSGPAFVKLLVGSAALVVGVFVLRALRRGRRPLPPPERSTEDDDPEFRPRAPSPPAG